MLAWCNGTNGIVPKVQLQVKRSAPHDPVFVVPLQVRIEFERNMENTSVEGLIQKLAESKGTGKERPGKMPYTHRHTCDDRKNTYADQCITHMLLCMTGEAL